MKTSDIRQAFLNFYKSKNHEIVDSSSLIPVNDETLLFTNAGMVQFMMFFQEPKKESTIEQPHHKDASELAVNIMIQRTLATH